MSDINSNFTVGGGPQIAVKKVDATDVVIGQRTPRLTDSTSDTVKASMDSIANPPAPRDQMRGQQNSRNYLEDGKKSRVSERTTSAGA